jgi:hypothetical protein
MPNMRGGSDDTRTPDDEPNAVDAAWDELIGETGKDDGDSGQESARPVTADHAAQDGDRPGVKIAEPDRAAGDGRRSDADDMMARLMAGEAPKLPTLGVDARKPEPVGGEPVVADAPVKVAVVAEASVDAPAATKAIVAETPTATVVKKVVVRDGLAVLEPEPPKERVGRSSLRAFELDPTAASNRPTREDHPVRASRPEEPTIQAPPPRAPATPRGLPWAWIGIGAIALGAAAYFATRDDATPSRGRSTAGTEPAPQRPPREPVGLDAASTTPVSDDAAGDDDGIEDSTADSGDDTGTSGTKPPKPRMGNPREPPPGTPPEIAAVFRRLPVGPADRPPVGGIGATGIHIDHIAMGSATQGATCTGHTNDFSVSGGDRAAVCVRVVHSREKEELQVLWQKHEGSTRRSKMVVLSMHAYRTRGYLVLRNEYIGDWTVRILSSDGVELARHDFTVVP